MNITAGELIEPTASYYGESGICPNTTANRAKVLASFNEAIPLLLKRMDSVSTLWAWKVCIHSQTFSLPYDCLEIRQFWLDNQALVQRDEFYQGQLGVGQCSGAPWILSGPQIVDLGQGFALPYEWPNNINTLYGLTAEAGADAGKVVHLKLKDQHGNLVDEDVTLLPDQQMAVTKNIVTGIALQHKGQTQGCVRGSIVYPQLGTTAWIGTFHPSVITTNYRWKRIPPHFPCTPNHTGIIKGKLRYFPVTSELDPIPISDAQALGFAIRASYCARNKDNQGYETNIAQAVRELQLQLQDSVAPATVTQIQCSPVFGGHRFSHAWS